MKSLIQLLVVFLGGAASLNTAVHAQEYTLESELEFANLFEGGAGNESRESAIEYRFEVKPIAEAVLSSEKDGKVIKIFKKEGESFLKGDVLVEFDCTQENLYLDRSLALLKGMTQMFDAKKKLSSHKAISKLDVIDAEMEFDNAVVEKRHWEDSVKKCRAIAPFNGQVVSKLVKEHQYLSIGTPMLEIIDVSEFFVVANVPSTWSNAISKERVFKAKVLETNEFHSVQFDRVGPLIDAISQTVRMYGVIENKFNNLRAGMSGFLMDVVEEGERLSRS